MDYVVTVLIIVMFIAQSVYLSLNKRWGELLAVVLLWSATLIYDLALLQDWQIPTLKEGAELIFIPVTRFAEALFQ